MTTARETVMTVKAFGLALVAAAMTAPAFAHHSFAMFDAEKTVTMTGVVKEFEWTNPHSWIRMMVEDQSGTARQWALEMGSPGQNAQRGWKADTLKPGDKVTVTMHPLEGRLARRHVSLRRIRGRAQIGPHRTGSG